MKTILLSLIILMMTPSPGNDMGKLSGMVSFSDNDVSENRADAGCKIFAINQNDVQPTHYYYFTTYINNFQAIKSDYLIAANDLVDPYRIKKAKDLLDATAIVTGKYIKEFRQLPGIVKSTSDEKGKFAFNLPPGKYYLLFISGHVKSNNLVEIEGNVEAKEVVVKRGGETTVYVGFKKQPMIWIKRIEAMQRIGC
jgi:hypothetical protein